MGKRQSKSQEQEKIAKQAAQMAAEETAQRLTSIETDDEEDSISPLLASMNGGSHPSEPVVEQETDVFVVCNQLAHDGRNIRYEIHKNGAFIGSVFPPFSWDEIKAKYGESGVRLQFRIIARDSDRGHIVKKQTTYVETPASDKVEEHDREPQQEPTNVLEIARMMSEANDRTRREMMEMFEKQRAEQNSVQARPSELTELLKTVLPVLLAPKKEDNSQLREVMSDFKQMFTQMKADADRKNDRLELELKHLAEKMNQKPNNEMDPWKIIATVRESENRGFELRERLSREAEERADEKAAAKGDGGEKSTIDQIIETGAKLLNSGMLKGMGQPQPKRRFVPNPTKRPQQKLGAPRPGPAPTAAPHAAPQAAPRPSPVVHEPVDDSLPTRDFTEPMKPLIAVLEESVTESLTAGEDPKVGAERLVKKLEALGVPLPDALQEIPLSRAIELSKSRGMPELVETWLAQTYGILNAYDVSGTENSGVQPGPGGNE